METAFYEAATSPYNIHPSDNTCTSLRAVSRADKADSDSDGFRSLVREGVLQRSRQTTRTMDNSATLFAHSSFTRALTNHRINSSKGKLISQGKRRSRQRRRPNGSSITTTEEPQHEQLQPTEFDRPTPAVAAGLAGSSHGSSSPRSLSDHLTLPQIPATEDKDQDQDQGAG